MSSVQNKTDLLLAEDDCKQSFWRGRLESFIHSTIPLSIIKYKWNGKERLFLYRTRKVYSSKESLFRDAIINEAILIEYDVRWDGGYPFFFISRFEMRSGDRYAKLRPRLINPKDPKYRVMIPLQLMQRIVSASLLAWAVGMNVKSEGRPLALDFNPDRVNQYHFTM